MKNPGNKLAGEEGAALLMVLLVLALLTVLGIGATRMSTTELKIATNDKSYKMAFYHAEGGIYAVAKWLSRVNDDYKVPDAGDGNNFSYLEESENLLSEAMGYSTDDTEEIEFAMETQYSIISTVDVDYKRGRTIALAGGGAASLGEGASTVGSGPAMALPYWLTSTASMSPDTNVDIAARYLKIDGIAGGL
jgi:Tfp pilus assembly protein PilX